MRRLWLSLAMLATGVGLLVSAELAGASGTKYGGIFRVGSTGASVQVDPQIGYITTAWWLEYATAAKLYNWKDGGNTLVPEVASSFGISNHGRTYTFTIRRGFRFSDGSPVTARNFAYAIDRVANHDLGSPGAQFITDPNGTDIVGALAVNGGDAKHVSGVVVKSRRLIIRLVKADPSFLFKLTMPFFQATSTALPLTHEVTGSYPSAGPYFYSHNDVNVETSIRRNPFWTRGPGRTRPRNLTGLDIHWNLNQQAIFDEVQANQLDEDADLPPDLIQSVANEYGVNRTRFWVKPQNCIGFLLFNTANPLFHKNVPLRKAINWAVDRTDYAAPAGPYAGSPWTHLLPPGFPGSISAKRLQPYSPRANIPRAKKLAAGHFRSGKIVVLGRPYGVINPNQASLIRRDLIRLGFKPQNVTMKWMYCDISCIPPADWDISASTGWCADTSDPHDFFFPFLHDLWDPTKPGGLDSSAYGKKLRAASKLVGNARLRAFGKLDLEITENLAPAAPMRTYNNRYFFSNRVDPSSLRYSGAYQDWDIPALALK